MPGKLADVARQARVSEATVSRVLNGKPGISDATRQAVLTALDDELEEGWEGCLSVPGMRGLVPRFKRLRYQGRDQFGKPIDRTASDFHARVVQHECDHLDGILYPQRMTDHRLLVFLEEFQRHPIDLAAFVAEGRIR